MSSELLGKIRMRRSQRKFKVIHTVFENAVQLEDYIAGQPQLLSDNQGTRISSTGSTHMDKGLSYLLETDLANNLTRVTEFRGGDANAKLITTIEENFYYQHMFNFALVVILLLQVIVVWAFIWCRLSRYANRDISRSEEHRSPEDGIALNEIGRLPEIIPQQQREQLDGAARDRAAIENRLGRYG